MNRADFTDAYRSETCRIGQGHACCRYLTIGAAGWGCEKITSLKRLLDIKVAAGEMTARGDNCDGVDWGDAR